jgi:hypothetical protein
MKLTKGKISKIMNKKKQTAKKPNKKYKMKKEKKTFRKKNALNLANKTLKRIKYKKGGDSPKIEENKEVEMTTFNNPNPSNSNPISLTRNPSIPLNKPEPEINEINETNKPETNVNKTPFDDVKIPDTQNVLPEKPLREVEMPEPKEEPLQEKPTLKPEEPLQEKPTLKPEEPLQESKELNTDTTLQEEPLQPIQESKELNTNTTLQESTELNTDTTLQPLQESKELNTNADTTTFNPVTGNISDLFDDKNPLFYDEDGDDSRISDNNDSGINDYSDSEINNSDNDESNNVSFNKNKPDISESINNVIDYLADKISEKVNNSSNSGNYQTQSPFQSIPIAAEKISGGKSKKNKFKITKKKREK